MSAQEDGADALSEVTAIGISFGNSNSSIAYTSEVFPPSSFPISQGLWLLTWNTLLGRQAHSHCKRGRRFVAATHSHLRAKADN